MFKWLKMTQKHFREILKPYLDFIFWAEKSRFSVRHGGLSSKSPFSNHATLTDQPSEAPNRHKNHFWDCNIIKHVFNTPKMT